MSSNRPSVWWHRAAALRVATCTSTNLYRCLSGDVDRGRLFACLLAKTVFFLASQCSFAHQPAISGGHDRGQSPVFVRQTNRKRTKIARWGGMGLLRGEVLEDYEIKSGLPLNHGVDVHFNGKDVVQFHLSQIEYLQSLNLIGNAPYQGQNRRLIGALARHFQARGVPHTGIHPAFFSPPLIVSFVIYNVRRIEGSKIRFFCRCTSFLD